MCNDKVDGGGSIASTLAASAALKVLFAPLPSSSVSKGVSMRAAVLSEHGGPEVIRIAEGEAPEPALSEVRVMSPVSEGRLVPVIHGVMPLDDTRSAHAPLEAGEVFGRLVLFP